jgi:hypothetical protein
MLNRIVNRMVERAMPPYIDDPDQERIARDAAETAVRQTARVAGVTGLIFYLILFGVIAAILYVYFPRQQISQGPSEATTAAPQLRAEENARLRQAIADLQKKLDSIEDLQKKLDDVTKEQGTLQGKVAALEGQGAELDRKLQAARVLPAPKDAPQRTMQATRLAGTPVLGSRPSTYQCGDGRRTVRDPAECEPAGPGR